MYLSITFKIQKAVIAGNDYRNRYLRRLAHYRRIHLGFNLQTENMDSINNSAKMYEKCRNWAGRQVVEEAPSPLKLQIKAQKNKIFQILIAVFPCSLFFFFIHLQYVLLEKCIVRRKVAGFASL